MEVNYIDLEVIDIDLEFRYIDVDIIKQHIHIYLNVLTV